MSNLHWFRSLGFLFQAGLLAALGTVGICSSASMAHADCQTSYNEAMALLDATTKKTVQNEHPSPDAFSTQFKSIVGTLQSQKCMPELMSLIQHIQSEQQKLPSVAEPSEHGKNAPITD